MTKEKAERLLATWKARLMMEDWVIKLRYEVDPDGMPLDGDGATEWVESTKGAYIYMLNEKFRGEKIIPFDWEQILVHELLHIKFSLLDVSDQGDLRHRVLHQIIDELARALVDAERAGKGESTNE